MPQTFNVGARSRFVNFTAWLSIAVALLGVFTGVVERASQASIALGAAADAGLPLPWLTGLLSHYLPGVLAGGLLLSLGTLVAAVGLLRRVEWARRVFIGLLGVALVVNVAGLWLQQEYVQLLIDNAGRSTPLPPQAAGLIHGFATAARLLAAGLTLAVSAGLLWVIGRSRSPVIRQEFAGAAAGGRWR